MLEHEGHFCYFGERLLENAIFVIVSYLLELCMVVFTGFIIPSLLCRKRKCHQLAEK